jgi:hypothetical protein
LAKGTLRDDIYVSRDAPLQPPSYKLIDYFVPLEIKMQTYKG